MVFVEAVRVATPEIRWHCGPTGLNEAVLSLDFLPDGDPKRRVLATGGADKEIKLWRVTGAVSSAAAAPGDRKKDKQAGEALAEAPVESSVRGLEFVFSLSGHDRSVNCVRFSPNGAFLASASDDTSIILWGKPKTADDTWCWDAISSLSDVSRTILACGHKGDITDLAWSPDSAYLCSTSVDNRCVIWNVDKGDVVERRKDHTQYVQGVAWDPLNEFLVTEGNDRTCRVYMLGGFAGAPTGKKQSRKLTCVQTIKTREFPSDKSSKAQSASIESEGPHGHEGEQKKEGEAAGEHPSPPPPAKHRMFHDDTCPAFARRPAWTPDGNYLLVPTGTFRATPSTSKSSAVNTVYAFARGDMSTPTLHLPGHDKASLAVRCSPLLYELRPTDASDPTPSDSKSDETSPRDVNSSALMNFFQTPYRSVFAVVTLNAVVLYDTQQMHPICTLKDLHYADLTDASWSADGQMLSVSSMDGYLSFIHFAPGFFGNCITREQQAELNNARMRRMFAVHKKTRKKPVKNQPSGSNGSATPNRDAAAQKPAAPAATPSTPNVLTVKRKKSPTPAATNPDKDSTSTNHQPAAATTSSPKDDAGGVNVLQVRKKRKIAPTAVPPAYAAAATATPPATNGASTNGVAQASSDAPNTNTSEQKNKDEEVGTYDNPVEL